MCWHHCTSYWGSLVWGILEKEYLYHIPRPSWSYFQAVRGHVDVGSKIIINNYALYTIMSIRPEGRARGAREKFLT